MHKSFGFAFYLAEFGAHGKLTEYIGRLRIKALQKPSVVDMNSYGTLLKEEKAKHEYCNNHKASST